jgi:hypothetical protein
VREPLKTSGIRIAKRFKQSFYIAPSVGAQYALKARGTDLANPLVSVSSFQGETAVPDGLDPHFVVERHVPVVTGT